MKGMILNKFNLESTTESCTRNGKKFGSNFNNFMFTNNTNDTCKFVQMRIVKGNNFQNTSEICTNKS